MVCFVFSLQSGPLQKGIAELTPCWVYTRCGVFSFRDSIDDSPNFYELCGLLIARDGNNGVFLCFRPYSSDTSFASDAALLELESRTEV